MNKAVRIHNEETLSKFIHDVDGLHDALLHEAVLLHPGYVARDRRMFGDAELPSAHLIFQSQFPDIPAVRVDLKQVSVFRLEPRRELKLEGEITGREITLYPAGKHYSPSCEIRAAEVMYTVLGKEFLGAEYNMFREAN